MEITKAKKEEWLKTGMSEDKLEKLGFLVKEMSDIATDKGLLYKDESLTDEESISVEDDVEESESEEVVDAKEDSKETLVTTEDDVTKESDLDLLMVREMILGAVQGVVEAHIVPLQKELALLRKERKENIFGDIGLPTAAAMAQLVKEQVSKTEDIESTTVKAEDEVKEVTNITSGTDSPFGSL